jgi:ABC-type antimicrobial peptide transport system permease subunit
VLNTIYVNTLESIPLFAAMKAMGASTAEIVRLLFIQIGTLFFLGTLLAMCLMAVALYVSVVHENLGLHPSHACPCSRWVTAAISFAACLPSVRIISRIEPAEAFRS